MSATHKKCERLPMPVVIEKLKSSIDGRKYLLVLDDVWNDKPMEWEKLEVLLIGGARGSKILITTRAKLVARASNSIATHVLKGLSHDDSWALFKQVLFKRGVEHVSQVTISIGKEIIEKCVGVPLVIKAIGSMLAVKEREIDWLDFKKNDLPRVAQDSEGTVLPILKLSFDYLPTPLKRCFMYCAIYPEDHEFEKEELIGMWVAHGLIQLDSTTHSLEDVGEQYFMDLLDRSFFEVHWRKTYKMHDLIHDLAQSVGGDDYYNPGSGADYIDKSTRHAWVSVDELTSICHDGEKLRTLALTEPCNEQKVNELTSTFEQLRMLRLRNLWLTSVPQFVGSLRHLYYLDLSGNGLVSLPESICSLYNLQTLILCGCQELEELPAGTRDLVSLRHLDVSGCDKLRYMPRGLEELTCLQTLSTFVAGGMRDDGGKRKCAEVYELKSLVNLRGSLAITNLRGSKCERNKSFILMELKLVKQLELKWNLCYIDVEEVVEVEELLMFESLRPHPNLERLTIEDYQGSKFPSWMDRVNIGVSLPNIVYIKLEDCSGWRHVAALGLLPCLQQLHLHRMVSVEYLIDSSSLEEEPDQQLFPSLKELKLKSMCLKRLLEPTEASCTAANNSRYFPVLEKLQIDDCLLFTYLSNEDGKLFVSLLELCFTDIYTETIPSWVQYLPHLQTLKLSSCYRIVSLPEWISNLTSLQELHLRNLRSLASIPDCMHRLTSLQQLRIVECLKLERNESCILMERELIKQLELELNWKPGTIDVEGEVEEEESLLIESLKPHSSLERLIIEDYPGSRFPSWMGRVSNIVNINLLKCRNLQHLGPLGLLPCLQQLHISRMDSVEYLIDRSSLDEEPDQILFPCLKELYLANMGKLKSVVEPTAAANNSRYFPVLEKLEIFGCRLFTYLSNEDGKLFVNLLELCFTDIYTETLPSWLQYLPRLQTLKLHYCPEIVSLPEWMGNLTSLLELHLEFLDSLTSLPDCMQRLTSLQRLVIKESIFTKLESRCEKETGVDWHKIAHIPNITVW